MRLEAWGYLLPLIMIPLLHRMWLERGTPAALRFSPPIMKEFFSANPQKILLWIRYLALIFLLFALARPQQGSSSLERRVSGLDIVMVMDISASMNIEDLSERSRFDIAKDTMEKFISGRNNDRIGFVVFSGEPLTLAPLTLDYRIVLRAMRDAEIGVLKDGTAIGDGLSLAVNRLRQSSAKSRVIVLLTDGDNNVGQVDPLTAGQLAAGYGIKVYTIAIGKEGRVRMPIRRKGTFGGDVVTYQWFENALNPELLQKISELTAGRFYRVTDEKTLSEVFSEIDRLEKTEIKTTQKIKYDEAFFTPLLIGVLLLVLEQLLSLWYWRVV